MVKLTYQRHISALSQPSFQLTDQTNTQYLEGDKQRRDSNDDYNSTYK